jgi:hypothetical protein
VVINGRLAIAAHVKNVAQCGKASRIERVPENNEGWAVLPSIGDEKPPIAVRSRRSAQLAFIC